MKTERRHELQTNSLAEMLNEAGENAKPYAKGILGVALAALVIFGVYLYLSKQAVAEVAAGWDQTFQALNQQNPTDRKNDLKAAAEAHPNKPSGIWAALVLADTEFDEGVQLLFTDRGAGTDKLNTALDDYKSVLEKAKDQLVRQHSLYGVGRTNESLDKLDDARAAYDALVKDYPNGPYTERSKQRLTQLAQASSKEWYDWFRRAEPAPNVFGKDKNSPFTESLGKNDKTLFDTPEIKLSPEPKPDATKPDATKPNVKPEDKKTPGDKKSSETPASTEKPAGSKFDSPPPEGPSPSKSATDSAKPATSSPTKPDAAKPATPAPDAAKTPAAPKDEKTAPAKADSVKSDSKGAATQGREQSSPAPASTKPEAGK